MRKITKQKFTNVNSKNVTLRDIIQIKKAEKQLDKVELRENIEEVFEEIWS